MEIISGEMSSIGADWPPVPANNERLKGFYTTSAITNRNDAAVFLEQTHCALQEAMELPDVTRLTLRAVVDLSAVPLLDSRLIDIEAALPVRGSNFAVIYFGANFDKRQMEASYLSAHKRLLQSVLETPPAAQYNFEGIKIASPLAAAELAPDFVGLYDIFGYDIAETTTLIANPNNTIAYQQVGDVIVSTAMAEKACITIDGFGDLSVVEITEASTRPEYQGCGYYRNVSRYLIEYLLMLNNDGEMAIDVLYGESNLAMPGVIIAAHQNGRRFSYCNAEHIISNNPAFGILPQNFSVADGSETRGYNDFAVSYVPLERRG